MVHVPLSKTHFSKEEKVKYEKLKDICTLGLTHLTLELFGHRVFFERNFRWFYEICDDEISEALGNEQVEARILNNWITIFAAYRSLSDRLENPIDPAELRKTCVEGIRYQDKACKRNDERAVFWATVDFLHQDGQIHTKGDYRIIYETTVMTKELSAPPSSSPIQNLCSIYRPSECSPFTGNNARYSVSHHRVSRALNIT